MWYTKTKSIKQGRNKKVSYMMFNKFMQKNPLNVCGGGGVRKPRSFKDITCTPYCLETYRAEVFLCEYILACVYNQYN